MRRKPNYLKNVKIKICYTEHEHDIVYHVNFPEKSCEDYIGESDRRLANALKIIAAKIINVFKHSIEESHTEVGLNDFRIIGRNYNNNKQKRKMSEALLIKQCRSILNIQEQSIPLNF